MKMTVKKIDNERTSIINMIHTILDLTTQGDCITCESVEEYLSKTANYYTYITEVSTLLNLLTEMGYFTIECGRVEPRPSSIKKIYIRTDKSNDIF